MSTKKVAVAVIHGIGTQPKTFGDRVCDGITKRTFADCGEDIITKAVYWQALLDSAEVELFNRAQRGGKMRWQKLRRYMVDFLGDAFAYQPVPGDRSAYDAIHEVFAATLHDLAVEAGPDAPLCIIAHSLGSVITSNYVYDLQQDGTHNLIADKVRDEMTNTPIERGETLSLLYTLGSPIALFSLRFTEFGRPITMPPPQLHTHHPGLYHEWINFYDPDDAIGFPLRELNDLYRASVKEDRAINVGRVYEFWNPLSHLRYWTDSEVLDPIAKSVTKVWKQVNGKS